MARLMGLDVGSRTVGIAVSDELGWTAQGVEIIKINEEEAFFGIERVKELVEKYDVCGSGTSEKHEQYARSAGRGFKGIRRAFD